MRGRAQRVVLPRSSRRSTGKEHACPSPEGLSILRSVEHERKADPYGHSPRDLSKRAAEDPAQQPSRLGTEGGAYSDFATTLGDGEGYERVDPCGRQKNHAEQGGADWQGCGRQASALQAVGIPEGDHLNLERRVERRGDRRELSCERPMLADIEPHRKTCTAPLDLLHRMVDAPLDEVAAERVGIDVLDHAHHFEPAIRLRRIGTSRVIDDVPYAAARGLAAAEQLFREGPIDQDHIGGAVVAIARAERTSREHVEVEGVKEVEVDRSSLHLHAPAGRKGRGRVLDRHTPWPSHRREVERERVADDARFGFDPAGQFRLQTCEARGECRLVRGRVLPGWRLPVEAHLGEQHLLDWEPGNAEDVPHLEPTESDGDRYRGRRDGYLDDDERRPGTAHAQSSGAVELMEVPGHASSRRSQGGNHAGDHRGECGKRDNVHKRGPLQRVVRPERRLSEPLDARARPIERHFDDDEPDGCGPGGEQERLGEQLRDDPPAAGPERRPDRDLTHASCGPRVDQNGDVDADDDEDEAHENGHGPEPSELPLLMPAN